MKDYKKLSVWSRAHKLTLEIYKATVDFPTDEKYGVTSQLRRAAVSIPTNIAEGSSRRTDKDFARFVQIAIGSSSEVDYLILLSRELNYIDELDYKLLAREIVEIRKMLIGLSKKLRL
ncbi:MAG TPA: four helix bundle protein [bacterium]|nr:four helix bundle protein [bacterium]